MKRRLWIPAALALAVVAVGLGAGDGPVYGPATSTRSGLMSAADKRKSDRVVTPEDYGAVGDGTANDNTAVQAALSAAKAVNGELRLSPGKTYLYSAPLVLDSRVTIHGPGTGDPGGTTTKAGAVLRKNADFLGIQILAENCCLEGFSLDSASLPSGSANGIEIGAADNTNGAGNAVLRDLWVYHQKGSGVWIRNGNSGRIDNLTPRANGSHGLLIQSSQLSTTNTNSWTITHVDSANNGGDGLRIETGKKNVLLGVVCQLNAGYGWYNKDGYNTIDAYTEANTLGPGRLGPLASQNTIVSHSAAGQGDFVVENEDNRLYLQDGQGHSPRLLPAWSNALTTNQADFEANANGWAADPTCSIARTTTTALHGSAALAITVGSAVATTNAFTTTVTAKEGQTFNVLGHFKAAATPRTISLSVAFLNAGGSSVGGLFNLTGTDATTSWLRLTGSSIAPAGTTQARVIVFVSAAAGNLAIGEVHYVDKVDLHVGSSPLWTLPLTGQGATVVPGGLYQNSSNVSEDLQVAAKGTGAVVLNIADGTGGTQFGDGAGNVVGSVDAAGGLSVKSLADTVQALTYGTTVATNPATGGYCTLSVTDGVGFTVSSPSPAPGSTRAAVLAYEISNASGGAMGTITWGAAFKTSGSWANPANGKRRVIHFRWNGTNWVEQSVSPADITDAAWPSGRLPAAESWQELRRAA
jgi:hypothetical protein